MFAGDLSSFNVEFFSKFDVVVVSCSSLATKVRVIYFLSYKLKIHIFFLSMLIFYFMLLQKLVNEKCRKLPKRVAFYTVDCKDSCGEIFVDLQVHRYSKVIPVCNLFYLSCIWYLCHFLDLSAALDILSMQ